MWVTDFVDRIVVEKSANEKLRIVGISSVIICLILYLFLYKPLLEQQQHLQVQLTAAHMQYDRLFDLSQQLNYRRISTARDLQAGNAMLHELTHQLELSQDAMQHIGDNKVLLRFESVDFNRLILSLNRLIQQEVVIDRLSVSASKQAVDGTVKGEIYFKNIGER